MNTSRGSLSRGSAARSGHLASSRSGLSRPDCSSRVELGPRPSRSLWSANIRRGLKSGVIRTHRGLGGSCGVGMACCRMRKRLSWCSVWGTFGCLLVDALTFLALGVRSRSRLAAENLFLRKQLALYVERRVKSRRATDATRMTLVALARLMDWKAALTIVKPETLCMANSKMLRKLAIRHPQVAGCALLM